MKKPIYASSIAISRLIPETVESKVNIVYVHLKTHLIIIDWLKAW